MKKEGLLKDIFLSIVLPVFATLIANVLWVFLQNLSLFSLLQFPIPVWIFVLSVGFLLVIINFGILRKKVDPLMRKTNSKLAEGLNDCIRDFQKFFRHPYYAIIPNPFDNEPEFWKYYQDSFAYVLHSWFLSLKDRVESLMVSPSQGIITQYSEEFYSIVEKYLIYAETFRGFTKTYSIPDYIREQYDMKFVEEFNTTFRPNFKNYLNSLQKVVTKKIQTEIAMASRLK